MIRVHRLQDEIKHYADRFAELAARYDGTIQHSAELEGTINAYSAWITDERNVQAWGQLEQELELEQELGTGMEISTPLHQLTDEVRRSSAACVATMEKYRALKLLQGEDDIAGYFHNIESCIEQEFGSFRVSSDSTVLLVGSGSFPMTPLLIARRTGARVIGVDIDEEAVTLGRKVVERLGEGLPIRLENIPADQLPAAREATHIIFSSTVPIKYELLERMYATTDSGVVVAMRFGNKLKSLFNYPMEQVDEDKWQLADTLLRPGHIFDVALYRKANAAQRAEGAGK
ncbi:class I SAM-dependent methyltransferase [Paenibacillus sp. SYP-B4298]|uniref:class I SAM-dependent methyltransferase n=1 Tax=Paenibacillus sp. SYP-B4298 TaxID=2996034 RepID=UPI0022DE2996|nr:class I SAM-dependent methyltransferase [Paenibacillus sp. SYP-B4298]